MRTEPNRIRSGAHALAAVTLGVGGEALRFIERSVRPLLDIGIRLWLAQTFFVSGLLKATNWETTLILAREEYPVAWMDPVTAAYLGVAIELVAPVLLALGFATRLAALSLLALALVIQLEYRALDIHLFWAAVCAWYVLRGAGALALDRPLARGLVDSAVPFTATWFRLTSALERYAVPGFLLTLRIWIAVALLAAAAALPASAWLPAATLAPLASGAGFALAALLAAGVAARAVALVLIALLLASGSGVPAEHVHWLALTLAVIFLDGAGTVSLDAVAVRRFPELAGRPAVTLDDAPRIVVVGAGFGGLACARGLARGRAQVTLIDLHNYHLFQPLLYQVATAGLSPGDIAMPVRTVFREQRNARVLLGEVMGVDTARQQVLVGARRVPYDYLVLATGASHSYFGRDEWALYAPGLKRIEDATEIRGRLLLAFEHAEAEDDSSEHAALLTFLIVGGGPTGVELAGAIAELARHGMDKEFRRFDPASARVVLVQSAPRLLPTFPERLSAKAKISLERLGVEVRTGSRVEGIDAGGVLVNGERIAARTVLWAAGVVASPAARWLGAVADNAGRVKVGSDLSVPGLPNVFVIGDTAEALAWNGKPAPGLAPAAKQGGEYVARVICARLAGRSPPPPFRYRHLGSLATIGRKAAVADFGRLRLSGVIAWWLWGLVHVYFLVGLRNRVSVMFDWFWSYLTYRASARLITGGGAGATPREVSGG